jgi:hypothetical protein
MNIIGHRLYKNCPKRTLLLDDGSSQPWKETGRFPQLGDQEILIRNIQTLSNLKIFVSLLLKYYSGSTGIFYFRQEEVSSGTVPLTLQFEMRDILELIEIFPQTNNLDSILVDSQMTWLIKFHHELFGYVSGSREFVDLIKSSDLSNFVDKPVWEKCD